MKNILNLSILSVLLGPAAVWAQAVAEAPASSAAPAVQQPAAIVPSEEGQKGKHSTHIRYSDSGNTVEEVREGAETKNIHVKPNNAAPQYDIVPDSRSGQPGHYGKQGGKRMWKVLNF